MSSQLDTHLRRLSFRQGRAGRHCTKGYKVKTTGMGGRGVAVVLCSLGSTVRGERREAPSSRRQLINTWEGGR